MGVPVHSSITPHISAHSALRKVAKVWLTKIGNDVMSKTAKSRWICVGISCLKLRHGWDVCRNISGLCLYNRERRTFPSGVGTCEGIKAAACQRIAAAQAAELGQGRGLSYPHHLERMASPELKTPRSCTGALIAPCQALSGPCMWCLAAGTALNLACASIVCHLLQNMLLPHPTGAARTILLHVERMTSL